MKSSPPVVLAGIVSCILIAGCVRTPQASVPNPPASSYQVGSFELQGSGSSLKVRGASVTATFLILRKSRLCSAVVSYRKNTAQVGSKLCFLVSVSGSTNSAGTHE